MHSSILPRNTGPGSSWVTSTHSHLSCHNCHTPTTILLPMAHSLSPQAATQNFRPLPHAWPMSHCLLLPPGNLTCHLPLPPAMSSPFTTQRCWRRGADLNLKSCCVGRARSPILTQMRKVRTYTNLFVFLSLPILPSSKTQGSPHRPFQQTYRAFSTLKAQGSGQGQHVGCKQESKGDRSLL